jgi:hypothetical protein
MTRKGMRWFLGVVIGFLTFVGVGASVTHYLQEPYNPGFLRFPIITALHVVLGGFYLALAPFQLVKIVRSRHLRFHRRAGGVRSPPSAWWSGLRPCSWAS